MIDLLDTLESAATKFWHTTVLRHRIRSEWTDTDGIEHLVCSCWQIGWRQPAKEKTP